VIEDGIVDEERNTIKDPLARQRKKQDGYGNEEEKIK
jgi:hypothetical protein